ncbi:MAG: hypothetical protein ACYDGR_01320 [Candidatus Dormibacteria bacterium]
MLPAYFNGFLNRGWNAVLDFFTTRSAREFERFTAVALPGTGAHAEPAPSVVNIRPLATVTAGAATVGGPADCEELFTRLLGGGHYDSAWDLLTPDSQASWDGREAFKQEMGKRRPTDGVVASKVREVRLLPVWHDKASHKTYHQVAELVVDYHIRQPTREMVVTRDVHMVNVSGGWKSLCYRS